MKMVPQVRKWQDMRRVPPCSQSIRQTLVYAQDRGRQGRTETASADRRGELERLKEQLTPYMRELIQKMLKEEREYYKSRPSLAARHYGAFIPEARNEDAYISQVTREIYREMEGRLRKEWLRKGRG